MSDKTDWTKPLTLDDDLCAECGDTTACPETIMINHERIPKGTQSIEVEGFSICLTCPNYTVSTQDTRT